MAIDLSLIWAALILIGVAMYVFMDGFDLGIGILFPFVKDAEEKDILINTVAPVWDGNETWLVLGGAALFGAFPLAYAVILDALTIPLTLMLLGLIFRGVAFEFRFKATPSHRAFWDKAFVIGSLIATFFQGVTIGAFIYGFEVVDRHFVGGYFDWFTFFPLFCGVGLIIAYALLGSTWLIMKTEHHLQAKMKQIASYLVGIFFIVLIIISIITPMLHKQIAERWFNMPNIFILSVVPLLVVLISYGIWKACHKEVHSSPFILSLFLIFLGLFGFVISVWPYVIPTSITIWEAAAPAQSQLFALIGTLFILPIVLMYTAWTYYVFRGKVKAGEGYHH
ncbi:cytochrome d ubiquinol oxidase subunit II [Entomomonas moraniae]|uniref:Cytochrome d ubiquinol oxidase subunit II n=1 Tax=Entomomonas moraniae TaxID=2213226 RepID=A0A3S9XFE2_9GAMM|nr:cytochrome d ubiquinol oxidase subunit II [Entomomonas moraniae]AZS51152.1 cytochrome d ubiquinol oxidase subunit II [Entomomonas moraniae]